VVGRDPSAGMLAQARSAQGRVDRIHFELGTAEDLNADQAFDAILCNSALQWFGDPAKALRACWRALRVGGRMAVQAPARQDFCPTFQRALAEVARHPKTAATFAKFTSPWFLLETAEAYAELFRAAGFVVPVARIERPLTRHPPEQVMAFFDSAATVGYLSPFCYGIPLPDGYAEHFRRIVEEGFRAQAGPDGRVELILHRVYVLAVKPE
jgi:trans-aconitate methyltransferase